MLLANPIYDVVFKYLMEDNNIAKLYISKIIEEEILELDFRPQEKTTKLSLRDLTVYRLDFKAKIRVGDSYKIVIIEIQKAKLASDIMRFRKYLGEQYLDNTNTYTVSENKEQYSTPCPIISIYFLGYKLDHIDAAVVKVKRKIYDASTNQEIIVKEEFIESLTHDSYIIQIPQLKSRRKTDLEIVLSVFDQTNRQENHHILNVNEDDFPEVCRPIIRRLQYAAETREIRDSMDLEDEVLLDLQNLERKVARKEKELEQKEHELEKKDQLIQEKDQVIEQKEQVIEQKDQVIEQKEQVIEQKVQELERLKSKLKELGMDSD